MSKIFVRERMQVAAGAGRPRYVIVAALGTDLRVYARHFRKIELQTLAEAAGAEVVYLPRGEHAGEEAGREPGGREPGGKEPGGREPGGKEPGGREKGGEEKGSHRRGGRRRGGEDRE